MHGRVYNLNYVWSSLAEILMINYYFLTPLYRFRQKMLQNSSLKKTLKKIEALFACNKVRN